MHSIWIPEGCHSITLLHWKILTGFSGVLLICQGTRPKSAGGAAAKSSGAQMLGPTPIQSPTSYKVTGQASGLRPSLVQECETTKGETCGWASIGKINWQARSREAERTHAGSLVVPSLASGVVCRPMRCWVVSSRVVSRQETILPGKERCRSLWQVVNHAPSYRTIMLFIVFRLQRDFPGDLLAS